MAVSLAIFEFVFEVFEDVAYNFFRTGFVVFFLPVFENRLKSIFYHMLGAYSSQFSEDFCPFAVEEISCSEKGYVFFKRPLSSFDVGVKVVEPFFPALLEWAIELSLRGAEELVGDESPFIGVFFLVHDACE